MHNGKQPERSSIKYEKHSLNQRLGLNSRQEAAPQERISQLILFNAYSRSGTSLLLEQSPRVHGASILAQQENNTVSKYEKYNSKNRKNKQAV